MSKTQSLGFAKEILSNFGNDLQNTVVPPVLILAVIAILQTVNKLKK